MMRFLLGAMFLISTGYLKHLGKKTFLLKRLFSYLNLEISLWFRRKKCILMNGPLTSRG